MKFISIIGIVVIIAMIFSFKPGELGENQSLTSMPTLAIENAFASKISPNVITHDEQGAQDNSIFSWSTIILLGVAVAGIVAFRRNFYD